MNTQAEAGKDPVAKKRQEVMLLIVAVEHLHVTP
jgi:hypothetical protein